VTATYVIDDRFALQRSYYKGMAFEVPSGTTFTVSLPTIVWIFPPATYGFLHEHFIMKSQWVDWNSNTYTPDWIVDDFYYDDGINPHVTQSPLPMHICYDGLSVAPYILIKSGGTGHIEFVNLPPSPAGYWLPLPP
jgi:hypothetical protein